MATKHVTDSALLFYKFIAFNLPLGFSARRRLLVSTPTGFFQVPIDRGTAVSNPTILTVNASNPSHVQCDSARRQLYWAERGPRSTRIMRADIDEVEKEPRAVFMGVGGYIRYPAEGRTHRETALMK